tara:strand:+ start:147 stop:455 length:309 start_codon:yes stop_codon:yes gene_type:complete
MKITRRELRTLIEATITFSDEEKESITKAKSNAIKSTADGIARNSGLSTDAVADAAEKVDDNEAELAEGSDLEKIDFYKKYSYGLDDIPNKTNAHDDIIGHT